MLPFRKLCLALSALAVLGLGTGLFLGSPAVWSPCAVVAALGLALGLGAVPSFKGYQFTAWIVVAVVAGMIYPSAFQHWGGIDLRHKWLILVVVQLVMFGMGTQMSLHDFSGVMKNPRGVLVGILCHFTVMPLVGFGLTRLFAFPPEIAAGVILIGSCSSGLASNVMAYIARSNLVLSVTVTAITTLVAPFLTPLLMKALAGALVEVEFLKMMIEIIKIVIVPIAAALLHNHLKTAAPSAGRAWTLAGAACGAVAVALFLTRAGWSSALPGAAGIGIELAGFLLGAVAAGVLYHQLTRLAPRLDERMPVFSMAGIVYFTTVTTAAGRDNLLRVGALSKPTCSGLRFGG